MATVFSGGRLIDGTGRDPVDRVEVSVRDGRFARVAAPAPLPADANVVDCGGLTLLPGLIDLHTHMGVLSATGPAAFPPAVAAAHLFRNAELCLLSGHTTAREVAGADGGLRQAIDLGLVPGPRLYPSGPLICQTGGHGDHGPWFLQHHHHPQFLGVPGLIQMAEVADGVDGVRLAVRNAFRRGATQIKLCISGGVVSFTDSVDDAQFSVDELRAAVDEAHNRDTYVTAHAHNVKAINNGLDAGLECFEHGIWLDEPTAQRMAREGAALVPTLAVLELMSAYHLEWGVPAELLPRVGNAIDAAKASVKLAFDAGVAVGSGTDLLGTGQNRRGLELAIKAEVLGPMAAIVSATKTSAEIMRLGDQLGTVEEGKLADLIAVDGDPLSDPRLFDDPDRVVLVVKDGEIVKDLR